MDARLPDSCMVLTGHDERQEIGYQASTGTVPCSKERSFWRPDMCVLQVCNTAVVLRKSQDKNTLIGECYVDGIMHGEAMREWCENHGAAAFDESCII